MPKVFSKVSPLQQVGTQTSPNLCNLRILTQLTAPSGCLPQPLQRLPLHKSVWHSAKDFMGTLCTFPALFVFFFLHNSLLFVILHCKIQPPQKPWTLITASSVLRDRCALGPPLCCGPDLSRQRGGVTVGLMAGLLSWITVLRRLLLKVWKLSFHVFCPALQLNREEG